MTHEDALDIIAALRDLVIAVVAVGLMCYIGLLFIKYAIKEKK